MSAVAVAKHWILGVAVAEYLNMPEANLPDAGRDRDDVVASFERVGYARVPLPHGGLNLSKSEFEHAFGDWLSTQACPDDTLAFYFVGHGLPNRETREHFLCFSDLDPSNLKSALRTTDLLDYLVVRSVAGGVSCPVARALLVLDCCYAGEGATQVVTKGHGYLNQPVTPEVVLIPSTRPDKAAKPHTFSKAWAAALDEIAKRSPPTDAFLALDAVVEEVRARIAGQKPYLDPAVGVHGPLRFLPNPGYDPAIPSGLDLDARVRYQSDLLRHWVPRAKGGESFSDAWYFTGRNDTLRTLVSWLRQDKSGGQSRLVTGGPGTGKSAVLGRLVTLSDPEWRQHALAQRELDDVPPDTVPDVGMLSCTLMARKLGLKELAALLADGLDLKREAKDILKAQTREELDVACDQLIVAIRRRPTKTVILVDALDESNEAAAVAGRLLRHLTALDHVWLIVGSRAIAPGTAARVPALGTAVVELNLDQVPSEADIATYVERRLLARDEPTRVSPYRDRPDLAREVAAAAAQQAAGVFLIARLVASSLLASPQPVSPGDRRFPSQIDEAFEEYLVTIAARPGAPQRQRLLEMLAPFAFTEGEGMPHDYLFDVVCQAVCGKTAAPAEVDVLFALAGAFIVQSVHAERTVYRLYHEELARYVRERFPAADGAILRSLLDSVPKDDQGRRRWSNAHPYVAGHITRHAARTSQLDLLLDDPGFLATINPAGLVPHLSEAVSTEAREAADAYLLSSHRLSSASFGDRLSYLELAARQLRHERLAATFAGVPAPRAWKPIWIDWHRLDPHQSFSVPKCEDNRLLFETVSGVPRLFMAGSDYGDESTLLSWGLTTGDPRPTTIATGVDHVDGFCLLRHSTGDILIAGHNHRLRLWNLQSMTELTALSIPESIEMSSLATYRLSTGRLGIGVGAKDGTVHIYDYDTNTSVGQWTVEEGVEVSQLAFADVDGKLAMVSQTSDIRIHLDALADESSYLTIPPDRDTAVRFSIVTGREGPILVHSGYEKVVGRSLSDGAVLFSYTMPDPITCATTLMTGQRNFVVCSGLIDQEISVYDMADGKRVARRIGGLGSIAQMFAFAHAGTISVVTWDDTKNVRLWRLAPEGLVPTPDGTTRYDRSSWRIHDVAFCPGTEPAIIKLRFREFEAVRAADGTALRRYPAPLAYGVDAHARETARDWIVVGWHVPDILSIRLSERGGAHVERHRIDLAKGAYVSRVFAALRGAEITAIFTPIGAGRIESVRVLRPWWRRLVDWATRRPASTIRSMPDADFLYLGHARVGGEDFLLACTSKRLHILHPVTLTDIRVFDLPGQFPMDLLTAFDSDDQRPFILAAGDFAGMHFLDWTTGEASPVPWRRAKVSCVDVLTHDGRVLCATGCDEGVVELWTRTEAAPRCRIDLSSPIKRLFAIPGTGRLVAFAGDGLVCIETAAERM
jgi:WD40 repeat protein